MRCVPCTWISRTIGPEGLAAAGAGAGASAGVDAAGAGVCGDAAAGDVAWSCANTWTTDEMMAADAMATAARPCRAKGEAIRLIRSSQARTCQEDTRGSVFRTGSAAQGHSRWQGQTTPAPVLTPAENPLPEPLPQEADPELPRIHSIEDARRRGSESEKD